MQKEIIQKYKARQWQEDWLLTYADMMTLLLCFFLIIVTVSFVDDSRFEQVSHSLSKAMGAEESSFDKMSLSEVSFEVQKLIERSKLKGDLQVELTRHGVAVNMLGKSFFPSASAVILKQADNVLKELAQLLKKTSFYITVEGHTDSIPIHSKIYASNWDLSSARASSVVNFFVQEGIKKERLRAVGLADTMIKYAETDNQGREIFGNRAKNRRVVVLLSGF